jgi:hypothetical protein
MQLNIIKYCGKNPNLFRSSCKTLLAPWLELKTPFRDHPLAESGHNHLPEFPIAKESKTL